MLKLRKILITTDLSQHSLAAFDIAASLTDQYGAELTLLYVADESPPPMVGLDTPEGKEFQKRTEEGAQRKLDDFAKANIPSTVSSVVRVGDPSKLIIGFAAEHKIDLIVMATHGRTGLKHILLGSIAEQVVRTSHVPVLTIKPEGISAPGKQ